MRREGLAIGAFFIIAGTLFLLDALEVVEVRATYLWPLLLIGFGIAVIAGGRRAQPEPDAEAGPDVEPEHDADAEVDREPHVEPHVEPRADDPAEPDPPASDAR